MKNLFKVIGAGLAKLFFGSKKQEPTTSIKFYPPAGKQTITRSKRVQRIDGKTIIHDKQLGPATPEQMQRGYNKTLSLHAMFIQRAGLTNALVK